MSISYDCPAPALLLYATFSSLELKYNNTKGILIERTEHLVDLLDFETGKAME